MDFQDEVNADFTVNESTHSSDESNSTNFADVHEESQIPHSAETIRAIFENIRRCEDAANLYFDMESSISNVQDIKYLANVEDGLLSLACSNNVDALFFTQCFEFKRFDETFYFNRFFEYGGFYGFNEVFMELFSSKFEKILLPCEIFTKVDIERKKERDDSMFASVRKGPAKPNAANFRRQLETNKTSIANSYESLLNLFKDIENLQLLFSMVCVMPRNRKFEEQSQKIFLCSESDNDLWEKQLFQFRLSGKAEVSTHGLEKSIGDVPDMRDQFYFLSKIPNFHKWCWEFESKQNKLEQRFSCCKRYHPKSPRNRVINSIRKEDESDLITYCIIKNLIGEKCAIPYSAIKAAKRSKRQAKKTSKTSKKKSKKIDSICEATENSDSSQSDTAGNVSEEIMMGDRNHETENVKSNDMDIEPNDMEIESNDLDIDIREKPYSSTFQEPLFLYFCGELMRNGILKWRLDNIAVKAVVMNDIDKNCNFQRFQHVHVTAKSNSGGFFDISCTCQLYKSSAPCTDGVNFPCAHCRLFSDILCSNIDGYPDYIRSEYLETSRETLQEEVLEVPGRGDVRKFSVVVNQSMEFVTIYKVENTQRKVAQCLSNSCNIGKAQKRELSYLNSPEVCPHLATLCKYMDQRAEEFGLTEYIESEPFLPKNKWEDVFDVATGLYTFGKIAPSNQTVGSFRFSNEMKEALKKRDSYTYDMVYIPDLPEGICECGAGWASEDEPSGKVVFETNAKLYTELRQYNISVFKILCLGENCKHIWNGENECIYRSTQKICAGYELGWEYVDQVNTSKQTFSGFCKVMSQRYQSRNENSSYMSLPSFIEWWFGWASHMNIDFRTQCPSCGEIEVLACDGTKLGLGFTHAFVEPIETPADNENVQQTTLRRHDRSFIVTVDKKKTSLYSSAREHLRHICKRLLNCQIDKKTNEEFLQKTNELREILPHGSVELFNEMIDVESDNMSSNEREAVAKHFLQLSCDCSVDTFVPLDESEKILNFLDDIETSQKKLVDSLAFSNRQQSFCKEIAEIISASSIASIHGKPRESIISHLRHLSTFVQEIHHLDIPPAVPVVQSGSYNPCKFGRAFYFHSHGSQLREVRKFSIDNDRKSTLKNVDDVSIDECKKIFPQVGKKGTTYLFLWFCPNHGHCYGFHIIPGSEGRKDPAAALYTHMEVPPKIVMYDHACSLSEYVKNRESGYFSNTRFFHDVFHGYTHKCSISFRSNNVNLFAHTNTSICEQFNAYIQRIKSSAKHLTQCHFTFYLQFFIHQWNLEQKKRIEKLSKIRKMCNLVDT